MDRRAPAVAVIAHRGASDLAPEHTFASYDRALELDADYLELDLQLTADDQLAVIHDPTLDRTIRGPAGTCTGKVSDHTMAELRDCDAGTAFNEGHADLAKPSYAKQGIAELDDVFDRYGPDARYYIEIKAPDEQPAMVDVLEQELEDGGLLQMLADAPPDALPPVIIQSFSADALRRIHQDLPDLPLVQLLPAGIGPIPAATVEDIATYAMGIGPSIDLVDRSLVDVAHRSCLVVHPYTVNEVDEMERLIALGVDGMFTNRPDRLAKTRPDRTARDCK